MKDKLRLLNFTSIYPFEFLLRRQHEQRDHLLGLNYEEYYEWLISQRLGFSDFLTYYMNEAGWQAREVVAPDKMLLRKLPVPSRPGLAYDVGALLKRLVSSSLKDIAALRPFHREVFIFAHRWELLHRYIDAYQPDVVFVREPSHVIGRFWERYRDRCLVVASMGCLTADPWNWRANRYDLIFTLTEEYRDFFNVEGIESHLFNYGVDERVVAEVGDAPKKYDCTFVGYLGIPDQKVKTKLMEFIAQYVDFKWWGVRGPEIDENSALYRTYQGPVAGIEMFRIYKESKIVVNEYPEMAVSRNVNMRTMEVLNVGSFLLTRAASNIEWMETAGALVTFNSPDDCLKKIKHYLADEGAREKIAAQGLQTALEHFNYRDITRGLMEVIAAAYEKKRSRLKPWPAR
jgi:hypothetical protein